MQGNWLSRTWNIIPHGMVALFIIQIFSTMAYAILYSTLSLYMEQRLQLSVIATNGIMGAFLAFNYGLHLLGGYFGGRLLSFRNLFVLGMILQLGGCYVLSMTSTSTLFWGLALFLTGSGLNVTCMNMMVTQIFAPEDKRRETAFLWNYSGMNLGFWVGFALAGYYQLSQNYHSLFMSGSIGNLIALILVLMNWRKLADRNTTFARSCNQNVRGLFGVLAILVTIPVVYFLLHQAELSNKLVIGIGILMGCLMLFLAIRQRQKEVRNKMFAYIIFALTSLLFWTLYQIAPLGLTVFAEYNVKRVFFGYTISPQWIFNINSVVIIIGGPLMTVLLKSLRRRDINFSIPQQFSAAMLFIGLGFLILPIGISHADSQGLSDFNWILSSYILQSLGELLISPIGYAMIGQLAPPSLSSLMMGTWMMTIGVGGTLANYASNWALADTNITAALATNPGFSHAFHYLGTAAVLCSLTLMALIPFLRRLINEAPYNRTFRPEI